MEAAFKDISIDDSLKIIIAYEPIWAISSGKNASSEPPRTATKEDANDACRMIREKIESLYSKEIADKIIILYGGSMNAKNASDLNSMEHIDGGLVGGASLKPDEFIKIVNYEV
jgi:triosephosphate isomerase